MMTPETTDAIRDLHAHMEQARPIVERLGELVATEQPSAEASMVLHYLRFHVAAAGGELSFLRQALSDREGKASPRTVNTAR